VLIDPIDKVILKKHIINKNHAVKVIKHYLTHNAYTEFYSVNDYFIQQDQQDKITKIHTHILQRKPQIVKSLIAEAQKQEIVKIMPIAKDESDKKRLILLFDRFKNDLTLSWGVHPIALPHQFGIITAKNISKKEGALQIINSLNIKPNEVLGVGDSTSDWQFIEMCGYGAAMGNASQELKDLVLSKGKKFSYIGPSVDENGIIPILQHFLNMSLRGLR